MSGGTIPYSENLETIILPLWFSPIIVDSERQKYLLRIDKIYVLSLLVKILQNFQEFESFLH